MPRITDPSFVYVPAHKTDIGKRFRAILKREREFEKARLEAEAEDAEREAEARAGVVQSFKRRPK